MADIRNIWISKTSKWNEKTKSIDYFYKCELVIEGKEGVTVNLDVTDEHLNKVYKVISPVLKKALQANLKGLPDEL